MNNRVSKQINSVSLVLIFIQDHIGFLFLYLDSNGIWVFYLNSRYICLPIKFYRKISYKNRILFLIKMRIGTTWLTLDLSKLF